MNLAEGMRVARSQNLLRCSERAAQQLSEFKEATPITSKKSKSSNKSPKIKVTFSTNSQNFKVLHVMTQEMNMRFGSQ